MTWTRPYGFMVLIFAVALGCGRTDDPAAATAPSVVPRVTPTVAQSPSDETDERLATTENAAEPTDEAAPSPAQTAEPTEIVAADSDNVPNPNSEPKAADNKPTAVDATPAPKFPPPPRKPDGNLHRITFDDLKLDMPVDTKLRPEMLTDRAKELNGQRVSLKGFIYEAGIFQQEGIKEFLLVMNTQCKFGPGGEAFCVIPVTLKDGAETSFTVRPVTVEGVLKIDPFHGPPPDNHTWSVYRIAGDKVKH